MLCPRCFNEIDFKNPKFFCDSCNKIVDSVYDKKSKKYRCSTQSCQGIVYSRVCECGCPLPLGIENNKNNVIAIVGPKGVGKSQFITVLIKQLIDGVAAEIDASLDIITRDIYERNVNTLYRKLEVIPETPPGDVEPVLCYLKSGSKIVILSFYDTAGEDLNDDRRMHRTNIEKYLASASGLIYLVDPTQMPNIRPHLHMGTNNVLDSKNGATVVLDRITKVICRVRYNKDMISRKLDTKVAVVFTKADVLLDSYADPNGPTVDDEVLFDNTSAITISRTRNGRINLKEVDNISREIEGFISRYASDFPQAVSQKYKEYKYFMTSALGQVPNGIKLSYAPKPFRIEDPLLWLLYALKTGIVKK